MNVKIWNTQVVAIFFRKQISFQILQEPPTELQSQGIQYTARGSSWNGFYDWLRSGTKIIGVRQSPSERENLVDQLPAFDYIRKGSFGELEVFFAGLLPYDSSESSDQGFGFNQFWCGTDGSIALLITLSDLSEDEVRQVESYG